jgi:hypothetical protein
MGERNIALYRHLAATDEAAVGNGGVWHPDGTRGHDGGTCAGATGDAVDARGLDDIGAGPFEQDALVNTSRAGTDSPATPCPTRVREGLLPAVDVDT